ncbi:MAG: nickel pincer cofactor biosynthesis protein LarC [Peptococcaceae bacterium]|nr:nickel pincer cofactor biosynthesis protein LarC [Peptococcaceae bacterium]
MKILYLDCFSGISGDMCLGALIDAGVDRNWLESKLRSLPLQHWDMTVDRHSSRGIEGTRVKITVEEDRQPHRHLGDIKDLITRGSLPERARCTAINIFQRLAEAEGKVHGVPADQVHFHEVGAVDSIIDVVGTSLAVDFLEIDRVVCSPLPPGRGYINCRHGIMPVPAPATAELLKGVPLRALDVEGELATPTGAAIAVTLAGSFGPLPEMTVESVGYGLGSKDFGIPNSLRVFKGRSRDEASGWDHESVLVMETNIDDMNPEFTGHVAERLFARGALDVFISTAYMKKGRLGCLLTIICRPQNKEALLEILFRETTTLGVRFREERRAVLVRRMEEVATPYGKVRIKTALGKDGRRLKSAPEYEDCKKIALEKSVPVKSVYEAALQAVLSGDR